MSYLKPIAVIGVAVHDEIFAQALLANPRQALEDAHLALAPDDVWPFFQGAVSLSELARCVLEWELASGRAETPLRVPALERVRHSGEPDFRQSAPVDDKVLAA